MKLLRIAVMLLCIGMFHIFMQTRESKDSLLVDAVSAATDGSECLSPSWIGCSVGWLEKGYVYDEAKGYYVKPSGNTITKQVTQATTTTTKASTTVTTTTRANASVTTADKSAQTVSTSAVTTTAAPLVTTTTFVTAAQPDVTIGIAGSYTTRQKPLRTAIDPSSAKKNSDKLDLSFLSDISLEAIAVALGSVLVMVVEFFVVKAIYQKD